jgi:phosphoglycolate phosphatase
MSPLTGVGAIAFDLDMTLVDSRPVSQRALERLAYEYGIDLDVNALMWAYGLPLSRWLPPDVDAALFRTLQSQHISSVVPMPGAGAAVHAVRQIGARVVVVTAAPKKIASGMLAAIGVAADRLWTDVWASGKATPLRDDRCSAFVGDHPDDMSAARQAGAIAIGVRTGTTPPIGADVTLETLRDFPSWLDTLTQPPTLSPRD